MEIKMSRSPHAQSDYKMRKLPRCTRCNIEFVLVWTQYENLGKLHQEWECLKCKKIVSRNLLKEDPIPSRDEFLHKRFEREQKKDEERKRQDNIRTLRNNFER